MEVIAFMDFISIQNLESVILNRFFHSLSRRFPLRRDVFRFPMRQQRTADCHAAGEGQWPEFGSIRAELVEILSAIAHDENAWPRGRHAAAEVILEFGDRDRMARMLTSSDEFDRSLFKRLEALEANAAGRKRAQQVYKKPRRGGRTSPGASAPVMFTRNPVPFLVGRSPPPPG